MWAEIIPALAGATEAACACVAHELVGWGTGTSAQDNRAVRACGSQFAASLAGAWAACDSLDGAHYSLGVALDTYWFGASAVLCWSMALLFTFISVGYSGTVSAYHWGGVYVG